jgi:hypothetical protein
MSEFRDTFRIPLEKARDEKAFGHVCGMGDESHAWNPLAVHTVGPPGMFSAIELFVIRRFKPVVENVTEITDDGGASGILIVSLIAPGRNSYVAPGIFA